MKLGVMTRSIAIRKRDTQHNDGVLPSVEFDECPYADFLCYSGCREAGCRLSERRGAL